MSTPQADMNLRDYVRAVQPEVWPDLRPYHWKELIRSVDQFCEWLGEDIAVGDVTTEMVAEFATVANAS